MKKLSWVLVIFCICLLTGCAADPTTNTSTMPTVETPPIEYVYTEQEILYAEENDGYAFRIDVEYTQGELANYYFEPVIGDAQRQECIAATEQLLKELGTPAATPEIFVFSDDTYDSVYITGNRIYMCQRQWKTTAYAADLLLTVFGRCSHYGLAFGYAAGLCEQLGWECEAGTGFAAPDATEICDLGLLCFDTAFVSEKDAAAAAQIAVDFANSYRSAHGEAALRQLLSDSDTAQGMETLGAALGDYYHSKGMEFAPSAVRYGYGGKRFDYIVESDLAAFYVETDWVDANWDLNPLVTENFLHENYGDVRDFFEINLEQMARYRALFALEDYREGLQILFSNNGRYASTSVYHSSLHKIWLKNVDSLMHEYIHALTPMDATMQLWQTEGFARYFSYRYDRYGMAFLNQDYNHAPESAELQYVHEYLERIGRPIDMAVDYEELENIAVYSYGLTNPNSSYLAGSSFVQYLVKQYGEERIIGYLYGSGEALPKNYAELVQEWKAYLNETYQTYSKYSK